LRDLKGLTELNEKSCDVMGIENETSAIAVLRIKDVASTSLGRCLRIRRHRRPYH
jgi:hypothetical protein